MKNDLIMCAKWLRSRLSRGWQLTLHHRRLFSTSRNIDQDLRIGYVPEHFSTPIHFARQHFGLPATLIPFPSGTGHMIESLKGSKIDIGIGLTEAWVTGIAQGRGHAGYRIVGSYVKSPLQWAVSTGSQREITSLEQLKGSKIGVSRIGSGSYIMPFVMADQLGWLIRKEEKPFEFISLSTFDRLRQGVTNETIDAFMWEYFTSKRYYDDGTIKHIGDIHTPWASWKIAARDPTDKRITDCFERLNRGIQYFQANSREAIAHINATMDYSVEDATAWFKTVEFVDDTSAVGIEDIEKTIELLDKAGVIDSMQISMEDMVS